VVYSSAFVPVLDLKDVWVIFHSTLASHGQLDFNVRMHIHRFGQQKGGRYSTFLPRLPEKFWQRCDILRIDMS
jgi:hypothetical protein